MFDGSVFKVLSHNDTGAAIGHQGGLVIPLDIEDFFPDVSGIISAESPTADVQLTADLFIGNDFIRSVQTRYQYQTWGGTRSPERRLTSNLGEIRNVAVAGDLAVFSRDIDRPKNIKIMLFRRSILESKSAFDSIGTRRWGIFAGAPIGNSSIREAKTEIEALGTSAFSMFDRERKKQESIVRRRVRNAAFRRILIERYGGLCAVTGTSFVAADGSMNLDAAHIVPVELGGSDDPRNGLVLSKDFHWAFDRGIIYVTDELTLGVSKTILDKFPNPMLGKLHGSPLILGKGALLPSLHAIDWHRKNIAVI